MMMERMNTVLMIDSFRKMWLSCEFQWLRQTGAGFGDLDPRFGFTMRLGI